MGIDYSDTVGWPATSTRVTKDSTRIAAKPLRQASRQRGLDRHARYRERKRLAKLLAQP